MSVPFAKHRTARWRSSILSAVPAVQGHRRKIEPTGRRQVAHLRPGNALPSSTRHVAFEGTIADVSATEHNRYGCVTVDVPEIYLDVYRRDYPADSVRAMAAELVQAADVLDRLEEAQQRFDTAALLADLRRGALLCRLRAARRDRLAYQPVQKEQRSRSFAASCSAKTRTSLLPLSFLHAPDSHASRW